MKADSTYLHTIQASPQYDYMSALDASTTGNKPNHVGYDMERLFNDLVTNEIVKIIALCILAIIVGVIAWRIIRKFMPDDMDKEKSLAPADTIYGHEWDKELDEHMKSGNYTEAVVLCYLRFLNTLNDNKTIAYSESKTPNMYLAEVEKAIDDGSEQASQATLDKLRVLTHNYLLVRYGHRSATEQLTIDMMNL